ncbi:hypothetical protein LY78DRAFT_703819 [Colletotrichum sublineola]|nr:hypothetical protein LY78DRAFT_703819 [Colletotrichum sublineola]
MSEKTAPTPSQSDINFMVQIFQHMTEKPNIDWQSFADAAGFKNTTVAHTRWGQIKRKFNNSGVSTTPKKTKTPASNAGSVSKIKKATGRVGAKAAKGKGVIKSEEEETLDEDDEGFDTPTKEARIKVEDAAI